VTMTQWRRLSNWITS